MIIQNIEQLVLGRMNGNQNSGIIDTQEESKSHTQMVNTGIGANIPE